jgi:hypothetical protein
LVELTGQFDRPRAAGVRNWATPRHPGRAWRVLEARPMRKPTGTMFALYGLALASSSCVVEEDGAELGTEVAELGGGTPVPIGTHEAVGTTGGCTGTLIDDDLVLLAAHCICNDSGPPFTCQTTQNFAFLNVRPVDNPQTPEDESATRVPTVTFVGATAVAHPDFNIGGWMANDLAVLRLPQPAITKALVGAVPVSESAPAVGATVTLVGDGKTDGPGGSCTVSDSILRWATTQIDSITVQGVGDRTIGFVDPTIHICLGDSGGPIFDTLGRVMGVASYGDGSTNSAYDSVYGWTEWIFQQSTSPGNRVAVWDLADGIAPVDAAYADITPDPDGLLGWIDTNDVRLTGDFRNLGHDQVLYINRGGSGGKVRIADYANGTSPTESLYWENWGQDPLLNGWLDSNDAQIVGDFLGRGYDQVLYLNRGGSGGRVMIVDYSAGVVPGSIGYWESYSTTTLNGWVDSNDVLVAGDFANLGYDQVLLINRSGSGGRIRVADFRDGVAPVETRYWENYGQSTLFNGWHDVGDLLVAGDFRDLGHDQLLTINRAGGGSGRVSIMDFSDWAVPAEQLYYEYYGFSSLLDGWHDSEDVVIPGDYLGRGDDQVLFVNRTAGAAARIQVADFRDGAAPVEVRFYQPTAAPIETRVDTNDEVLAGDFRTTGHDQVLTLERY